MSEGCSSAITVFVNNRPALIGAGNPTIIIENIPVCYYEFSEDVLFGIGA